jgi:hypothetical protein
MEDIKNKLILQSKVTAICGFLATGAYLVIALGWLGIMINEVFNPSVMGIMILFAPTAILFGVVGIFILLSSIRFIRTTRRADAIDFTILSTVISKNKKSVIMAIIATVITSGFGILAVPYIISSLIIQETARKLAFANHSA